MVRGIDSFRKWFQGYEEHYAIIGGTACDLLMSNDGLDFRATKDIDLVLIVEAMDVSFGKRFWEYVSSLSAILIDDGYYNLLKNGRIQVSGVTILDAPYLIPFKAKAWMDLSDRKAAGEQVDSRDIRKHKNDIFRLTELLNFGQEEPIHIPNIVLSDMKEFIKRMRMESVDLKQLGIKGISKEEILEELGRFYI